MKYLAFSICFFALVCFATCEREIERNTPERATIDSIILIHAGLTTCEPNTPLSRLGLDEMSVVEIAMDMEEWFYIGTAIDIIPIYMKSYTYRDFGDALQEIVE